MQATTPPPPTPPPPPQHVLNEMRQQLALATSKCGSLLQQLDIVKDRVRKSSSTNLLEIDDYGENETDPQEINDGADSFLNKAENVLFSKESDTPISNAPSSKPPVEKNTQQDISLAEVAKNTIEKQLDDVKMFTKFLRSRSPSASSDSSDPKSCKSKQDIIDIFFKRLENVDNTDDRSLSVYSATSRAFDNIDTLTDDDDDEYDEGGFGDILSSIMPKSKLKKDAKIQGSMLPAIAKFQNSKNEGTPNIKKEFNKSKKEKVSKKKDKNKLKTKNGKIQQRLPVIASPYQTSFIKTANKQSRYTTRGKILNRTIPKVPFKIPVNKSQKNRKDISSIDDLFYFMKEVINKKEIKNEKNTTKKSLSGKQSNILKKFPIYKPPILPKEAIRKSKSSVSTSMVNTIPKKEQLSMYRFSGQYRGVTQPKLQGNYKSTTTIKDVVDGSDSKLSIIPQVTTSVSEKSNRQEINIKTAEITNKTASKEENTLAAEVQKKVISQEDKMQKQLHPQPQLLSQQTVNNPSKDVKDEDKSMIIIKSEKQTPRGTTKAALAVPKSTPTYFKGKPILGTPTKTEAQKVIELTQKNELHTKKFGVNKKETQSNKFNQMQGLNKTAQFQSNKVYKSGDILQKSNEGLTKSDTISLVNSNNSKSNSIKELTAIGKKNVLEPAYKNIKEQKLKDTKTVVENKLINKPSPINKNEVIKKISMYEQKCPPNTAIKPNVNKPLKKGAIMSVLPAKEGDKKKLLSLSSADILNKPVQKSNESNWGVLPRTAATTYTPKLLGSSKHTAVSDGVINVDNLQFQSPNLKSKSGKETHHQAKFNSIPFIVGQSTSKSYHIGLNIQQTLSLFKLTTSLTALKEGNVDRSVSEKCSAFTLFSSYTHLSPYKRQPCPACVNPFDLNDEERTDNDPWAVPQKDVWDQKNGKLPPLCSCLPKKLVSFHEVLNQLVQSDNKLLSRSPNCLVNFVSSNSEEENDKIKELVGERGQITNRQNNTTYFTKLLRSIQQLHTFVK